MSTWLTSLLRSFAKPLQWWIVIALWEQGLRVRLGKTATVLMPGIHLRIPYLDRIYVQSIRRKTLSHPNITVTTQDNKPLTFTLVVDYSVSDVKSLFNSLARPGVTLTTTAASILAQFISTHDRREINIVSLEETASRALRAEVAGWGINQVKVSITALSETRTYRLMTNDQGPSGYYFDLDDENYNGSR